MPRPTWPTGMVMPVEFIRRMNEEMSAYNRDPAGYERQEREREEQRRQEEQEERDFYRQQWEEQDGRD